MNLPVHRYYAVKEPRGHQAHQVGEIHASKAAAYDVEESDWQLYLSACIMVAVVREPDVVPTPEVLSSELHDAKDDADADVQEHKAEDAGRVWFHPVPP